MSRFAQSWSCSTTCLVFVLALPSVNMASPSVAHRLAAQQYHLDMCKGVAYDPASPSAGSRMQGGDRHASSSSSLKGLDQGHASSSGSLKEQAREITSTRRRSMSGPPSLSEALRKQALRKKESAEPPDLTAALSKQALQKEADAAEKAAPADAAQKKRTHRFFHKRIVSAPASVLSGIAARAREEVHHANVVASDLAVAHKVVRPRRPGGAFAAPAAPKRAPSPPPC